MKCGTLTWLGALVTLAISNLGSAQTVTLSTADPGGADGWADLLQFPDIENTFDEDRDWKRIKGKEGEALVAKFDLTGIDKSSIQSASLNMIASRSEDRWYTFAGVNHGTVALDTSPIAETNLNTENWNESNTDTSGTIPGLNNHDAFFDAFINCEPTPEGGGDETCQSVSLDVVAPGTVTYFSTVDPDGNPRAWNQGSKALPSSGPDPNDPNDPVDPNDPYRTVPGEPFALSETGLVSFLQNYPGDYVTFIVHVRNVQSIFFNDFAWDFNTDAPLTRDLLTFDSTDDTVLPGGFAPFLELELGDSGFAGDFDGDSDVDGHDFLFWQQDPSVGNLSDWQNDYGSGVPAASALAEAPEPSTLFLMIGCAAMAGCARRRCCRLL